MAEIVHKGFTSNGEEYKIKSISAHYILLIDNKFYCSGDNLKEIFEELQKYRDQN